MSSAKHRGSRGLCPICRTAIRAGDELRWIALPTFVASRPVHASCFERDWEFIEAGLEYFPRLSLSRS
jgi:hypothetical protein